jgi:hypothetical protein
MNKIPQRNDWRIELRYILALFVLMMLIMGGLLLLGAVTHGWAI